MSDILSIIGIVVSIIGVIISLLLFNASIDNSRKVLINKAIHYIIFDHEILRIFSDATDGKERVITKERVSNFNKNIFKLEEMMNDIKIKNNLILPIVPESDRMISDNKYEHTFALNEAYKAMNKYFEERNLPNFYLMLNEFDDRCEFLQNYNRKE